MDDKKLISLVQKYENIYNRQASGFKCAEKKEENWLSISNELGFPVDHCIKRWRSLRDQYTRECRAPTAYGQSTSKISYLFDVMDFLKPHIKSRPARSKAAPDTVVIYSTDTYYDDSDEYIVPTSPVPVLSPKKENVEEPPPVDFVEPVEDTKEPSAKRPKISDVDKTFLEAVNCFKELCEKELSKPNTANEAFGDMVAAILNQMSAPKQNKAIQICTELLMKIKAEPE